VEPPAAAAAALVERILIGSGPSGAEARLTISSGPLAGGEILLRERQGCIDAVVLTALGGTRQTLSSMMSEVALRLEARGYRLRCVGQDPDPRGRRDRHEP
jgi:hypothetical protein